jgi:hypothetical protein
MVFLHIFKWQRKRQALQAIERRGFAPMALPESMEDLSLASIPQTGDIYAPGEEMFTL